MNKFIIGLVLGLSLALNFSSFGFRTQSPPKVVGEKDLIHLNKFLSDIWNITNGKYSLDVVTSVPSGTADEGDAKVSNVGETYKFHVYINGAWRSWTSD